MGGLANFVGSKLVGHSTSLGNLTLKPVLQTGGVQTQSTTMGLGAWTINAPYTTLTRTGAWDITNNSGADWTTANGSKQVIAIQCSIGVSTVYSGTCTWQATLSAAQDIKNGEVLRVTSVSITLS